MRPEPQEERARIPRIGDRVEMSRTGVAVRGSVYYADQLQILVKWDDGRSSSLRVGRDRFRIIGGETAAPAASSG